MDFHFLVMEKSWKINVEKEGHPESASCLSLKQKVSSSLQSRKETYRSRVRKQKPELQKSEKLF